MKILFVSSFLLVLISNKIAGSNSPQILTASYGVNNEFVLTIDHEAHIEYGFKYPVTYEFVISDNNNDLKVFHKHKLNDEWDILLEKTENDFFNATEAVRFDYANKRAYVSIAFSSVSDTLIILISDDNLKYKRIYFEKICKYYDNRDAVVTTTADDLGNLSSGFAKAMHEFRERKLWLSCGAVTSRFTTNDWNDIQLEVDKGYIEIDSHSRTHVPTPYDDYESEVAGSRDDIINNLELPSLFSSGGNEYVYCYIYPYGNYTNTLDRTAGTAKYLINRKVNFNEDWFTEWNDSYGMFERVGVVHEVGPNYGGVSGISDLELLNSKFDEVITNRAIYHFSMHPNGIDAVGDWEAPYMQSHLDYISGHKNIWYVGFGHLYLYNFLRTQLMKPQMAELDIKIFLEGAYSENNNMSNVNHNCLPLTQPYKQLPWNYAGNEHVTELANDVVDWILVELRDSGDMNNIIERRAGILLKNGNIKDMDGVSPLAFNVASDNYFIVIKHRNHIPIISSNFVSIICK